MDSMSYYKEFEDDYFAICRMLNMPMEYENLFQELKVLELAFNVSSPGQVINSIQALLDAGHTVEEIKEAFI